MFLGRTVGLSITLGMWAALTLSGQAKIEPRPKRPSPDQPKPQATLRVETTLVLVPVTVNDPLNRPVTGLEKENFRIFDDRQEQKITHFAMDDEPVAVGMVFDTSGSMGAKLGRSRMAAAAFFRTTEPDDEFFLVEFDNAPRLVVPLTSRPQDVQSELAFTRSKGSTALLDAIVLALAEIKKSTRTKKALLVVSDGGDNHSRYTAGEVRNLVRESDSLIYAIGVFGGGSTMEEMNGPGMLANLAEQTGGRLFPARWADLPDIAGKIGVELRNRYVLGYSPPAQPRDGRYHQVRVQVVPPRGLPPLRAHWRLGYYAPIE